MVVNGLSLALVCLFAADNAGGVMRQGSVSGLGSPRPRHGEGARLLVPHRRVRDRSGASRGLLRATGYLSLECSRAKLGV